MNEERPNPRLAWLQLATAIVLFGLSWPILKMTLAAATPVWMAAARATLSCLAAFALLGGIRRLAWPTRADWPIVLSVGVFQLTCFFAFANLGVQVLPAGRSGVLAYTTMLWMVPLSLIAGERVGWRGIAGSVLGLVGIVVLVDPRRFDWNQKNILMGHGWLLAGGFAWALAIFHARHHRWRMTPLQALPWQMAVATVCLWGLALIFEPAGHLDFDKQALWWGCSISACWRVRRRPGLPCRWHASCRRSPAPSACWAYRCWGSLHRSCCWANRSPCPWPWERPW
jgi:drug/metabolite transporter (DMT)-like permease